MVRYLTTDIWILRFLFSLFSPDCIFNWKELIFIIMDDQHQMPCWYYEKEELYKTPSYYDNIDHETETRHRREGARFLSAVSTKLNLRYDTCATAIVFFHRFYMFHSFKAFPRYVTAACCLMLAGKVEETPKKVRDIVKTARSLLSDEDFKQFGNDPREEVMAYERVLLKTIKFDLHVSHPYSYLLQYAKRIKGNQEKLKELVQMSWSFINDSLATTLCLQWEPEIVACAVLYLATRMSKFVIEDWEGRQPGQRWWECFVEGMSTEVMEDICHKILDLYPADGNTNDDQFDSANVTANNGSSSTTSSSNLVVGSSSSRHHEHASFHNTLHHDVNKYHGVSSSRSVGGGAAGSSSSSRHRGSEAIRGVRGGGGGGGEPPAKRQAFMRSTSASDYIYPTAVYPGASASGTISLGVENTMLKHMSYHSSMHYRLPSGSSVNSNHSNNNLNVYK
ncbi:unnamed protein product [Trichobilharzia szidati]|nr:unnamed protein product [Trichobilharzia szidati]